MRLRNFIIIAAIIVVAAGLTFVMTSVQPSKNSMGSVPVNTKLDRSSKDSFLSIVAVNTTGYPLEGAAYSISPNPFDNSKNYVAEIGLHSLSGLTPGVTLISGLRPGTYDLAASKAPAGYNLSGLPKQVYLTSKHTTTSAFVFSQSNSSNSANDTLQAKDVTYNVRFICGSVSGNGGPLRPGHYDTDISLFNNQGYTVPFLWNAVSNNGKTTTSILKILQSGTSSGIACKDLFQLFNLPNATSNLLEGFVVIRPQTSPGGLASFSGSSATIPARPQSPNQLSPLTVQVFYSANALLTLPHEVTMDKILFTISNDTSSKIPSSLLGKRLDVTIPSQLNQIYDPESEVRNILASQYEMSPKDLSHLNIQIISVGLGATAMIDDHAISSFQVMPQVHP